jgi:23S rRNA (uracil1939-C5)-methyltransferase
MMLKNEILKNLEVVDIANDGYGVVRNDDNIVVCVRNAVPGDIVDIRIIKKKKNYYEGEVLSYVDLSTHRNKPFCGHFGICGGCKWQNMKYESTLIYKQKHIIDCLKRISKLSEFEIENIIPSDEMIYYRNKMEYTFSNKGWLTKEEYINGKTVEGALGLHVKWIFCRVLNIEKCYYKKSRQIELEILLENML